MMTIAEQWVQEGRQEGMEKGLEKGEAKAPPRQLQVKFGPPEPAVAARIAAADSAQVERWLERILTAQSPDELFG
ncbi:MAG: transposase [Candidatus Competibacteraceae bacterium]|nr:MAG: transposase [Candidatus Competibacteraceae bacterium]